MNNKDEFLLLLKQWQENQNKLVTPSSGGVSFKCRVHLDTKPLTDFKIDKSITLKNIESSTVSSLKEPIIKLKYLFHLVTPAGAKILRKQLLSTKDTLLGNPHASVGNGRVTTIEPIGKNQLKVWLAEISIYSETLKSIIVFFYQMEAPGNPVETHAFKIKEINANF